MEKYLIFKVILFSYRNYKDRCERIDAEVKRIARSTANGVSIFKAFDEITKLINEKRVYCNLKVIIDDILKQMKNKDILVMRIIDGLSLEETSKLTGYEHSKICDILHTQAMSFYRLIIKKYCVIQLIDLVTDSKLLFNRYKQEVKKYKDRGC